MKNKIYQGSSKLIYEADEEFALIMAFTDKIKLSDGKILDISGKGGINNAISSYFMKKLDMIGVDTHFIEKINMREQLIQFVDVFPLQLRISTLARGRYVKEFGIEEGYVFDHPMIEYLVKSNDLGYPIINEYQLINFGWINKNELTELNTKAIRVFDFITGLFAGVGIRMVECKLEFGRVFNGEDYVIMLTDEISPDSCKLWDLNSNEKLGIEAIEDNHETAIKTYREVLKRLNI